MSKIVVTVSGPEHGECTMIGKTTVAAIIADALRTAFGNKSNAITVTSLDGDFQYAFARVTNADRANPADLGKLCPDIQILDYNGFSLDLGHPRTDYTVVRSEDDLLNDLKWDHPETS
ncbi:MAG TPA: hypothetical protein VN081_03110 [Dongiaceae bacterium]|nr:hypothetical protein [Dongiaceae bacterium]